jgi:hypothetical protein
LLLLHNRLDAEEGPGAGWDTDIEDKYRAEADDACQSLLPVDLVQLPPSLPSHASCRRSTVVSAGPAARRFRQSWRSTMVVIKIGSESFVR